MSELIVVAPLAVMVPRKTKEPLKCIINKNNERNWHYHVINKVKKLYAQAIRSQVEGLKFGRIKVELTYWKPTNRRSDRNNVLMIHDKFAMDALVEFGCIEDDNDEIIESSLMLGGQLDRDNPRVEIKIIELF